MTYIKNKYNYDNKYNKKEHAIMNIVLTTLNAKYIHTNLAIRYLKSYAMPEYDPIISGIYN